MGFADFFWGQNTAYGGRLDPIVLSLAVDYHGANIYTFDWHLTGIVFIGDLGSHG